MKKICNKCSFEKEQIDFNLSNFNKNGGWCKSCCQIYRRLHYKNNKEYYKINSATYYQNNQNKIDLCHKTYVANNKLKVFSFQKEYRDSNKEKLKLSNRKYQRLRWQKDFLFVLRKRTSNSINSSLKKNGSVKSGSITKYLTYSFEDLKFHLESQFESWMTWNNWGTYSKNNWDDNDQTTWTWQIDHIIPHSTFKYKSMEDEEFKKCWSLDNLRPYSAKQNLLDGNKR